MRTALIVVVLFAFIQICFHFSYSINSLSGFKHGLSLLDSSKNTCTVTIK